jgi:hypothetical protein
VLVTVMTQHSGAHAELIGQGAQLPAGTQGLVDG